MEDLFHVGCLFHAEGELVMDYCYAYDQFKIGCDHDQFRIGYRFDQFIIGYGDDQFIIGYAYDQFKISCACDQFIIGQIYHFKLVQNATNKVLVKITNI